MSWTPITSADGYKVQWKSGDEDYDEESRQAVLAGGDTASYTITGLTAGAERFRLQLFGPLAGKGRSDG